MNKSHYFFKLILPVAIAGHFLLIAACAHIDQQDSGQDHESSPDSKTMSVNLLTPVPKGAAHTAQRTESEFKTPGSLKDLDQDIVQHLEEEIEDPALDEEEDVRPLTKPQKEALKTKPEIDFELDLRDTRVVQQYIHHYTKTHPDMFQNWINRAEKYLPYIRKVFTEKGLPQDLIFLPFAESGFHPGAYSRAGAAGIWQFMPDTARMFDLEVDWWIDERRDPYLSTHIAAEYLSKLYDQFEDWYLVLAAYNAGHGRISNAIDRSGQDCFFDLQQAQRLPQETRNYIPKFIAILKIMRNLEELGFEPLNWEASANPKILELPPGTDLVALASAMDMQWEDFLDLNPAFRRSASPPHRESQIYMPAAKVAQAEQHLNDPDSAPYSGLQRHQVSSGDSWWKLARRFDVPVSELKRINQTDSNHLRPGQWVVIPASADQDFPTQQQDPEFKGTYTVQKGDNLWNIAQKSGVSLAELRAANNLNPSGEILQPGQELKIPLDSKQQTQQLAENRANYTVQAGDNLWSLANRFDVSVDTLIAANGLQDGQTIYQGDQLYIPDLDQDQAQSSRAKAQTAHDSLVNYQVQKGDSLSEIASKFGVQTEQLLAWNDLSLDSRIYPGDKLKIYLQEDS